MNFIYRLFYLGFLLRFILAYKPFELQSNINEIVNIDKETQDLRLREEEEKCNVTIQESIQRNNMNSTLTCPYRFDKIMCWPETTLSETKKNITVYLDCPNYINKFVKKNKLHKTCYFNYTSNEARWDKTKFEACFAPKNPDENFYIELSKHYEYMLILRIIGYVISILSLSVSILIVIGIKRLRFPRNYVHLNLFIAIILRLIFTIISTEVIDKYSKNRGKIPKNDIYTDNALILCRLSVIIFRYTGSVYHVAIFSEALYLVLLLRYPFYCEKRGSKFCILMSWFLPFLWMTPWVFTRIYVKIDSERVWCWQTDSILNLQLKIPHTILLLGNLVSAGYILCVLYSKLETKVSREKVMKYRRLAKSVMILIPIFGLHFILFAWAPYIEMNRNLNLVFLYIESVLNSFQGLVVAIACCFIQRDARIETLIFICNWYKSTRCYQNPVFQCISPDYVTMLRHKYRDNRSSIGNSFGGSAYSESKRRSSCNLYESNGRSNSKATSVILNSDRTSISTNTTLTAVPLKKPPLIRQESKKFRRQSSTSSLPSVNSTHAIKCYDCLFDKSTRNDFYQSKNQHSSKKRCSNDFLQKFPNSLNYEIPINMPSIKIDTVDILEDNNTKDVNKYKKNASKRSKFLSSSCKIKTNINKDDCLKLETQQSISLPLSKLNVNIDNSDLNTLKQTSPKVVHFNELNPNENLNRAYNFPFNIKKSNIKNKNKQTSTTTADVDAKVNITVNPMEIQEKDLLEPIDFPLLYQSINNYIDDDDDDNRIV